MRAHNELERVDSPADRRDRVLFDQAVRSVQQCHMRRVRARGAFFQFGVEHGRAERLAKCRQVNKSVPAAENKVVLVPPAKTHRAVERDVEGLGLDPGRRGARPCHRRRDVCLAQIDGAKRAVQTLRRGHGAFQAVRALQLPRELCHARRDRGGRKQREENPDANAIVRVRERLAGGGHRSDERT